MPSRSQRHMREFFGTYDADAAGQSAARLLTNIANQSTGTTLNLDVSGNFYGTDLSYSATGLPTGGSINASTGVITGTATPGSYTTCVVTAVNTYGTAVSNTFTWTVT